MTDDDLRARFDVLVDRVPVNADAVPLVRARAVRIRRRRATAAVATLTLVVVAAVAVPETLQHQAKSRTNVSAGPTPTIAGLVTATPPGPALTNSCTPALTKAGRDYGDIQHFYGVRTSRELAVSWVPQGATLFVAVPAEQPIDLCLIVGNLDRLSASSPPGSPELHMHYAALADSGGDAVLVEASPDPLSSPLPGVSASQIAAYDPTAASSGPPSAVKSAAAVEVPPCTSDTVSGMLRDVGLVDGAPQGAIDLSTTSAAGCFLRGTLQLAALTAGGAVVPVPAGGLPGPTNGVYAPLPVDTVLAPLSPGHALPAQGAGQLLRVVVGGDTGAATCAARDRQTRPASFRLTIGEATVSVANRDVAASGAQQQALVGCPGRFYAGSATLQ